MRLRSPARKRHAPGREPRYADRRVLSGDQGHDEPDRLLADQTNAVGAVQRQDLARIWRSHAVLGPPGPRSPAEDRACRHSARRGVSMDRLSALDAGFLYLETPDTPMHVGSLTIFASAAAARDKVFERFREHTAARLDLLPSYRRRLEMTPLGLDHPVWVDEDNLDLDYHLHQLTLPRPGTMEQLRALVARLHAIPLDRTRPLWQYHLIEGLEGGGFAVYVKVHHADMDGVAFMATLDEMYDFSPDSTPAPSSRKAARSAPAPPDFAKMTATAVEDILRPGFRAARALPTLARM